MTHRASGSRRAAGTPAAGLAPGFLGSRTLVINAMARRQPARLRVSNSMGDALQPKQRGPEPPKAIASVPSRRGSDSDLDIQVDNSSDADHTVIKLRGKDKPGLLQAVTACFRDLNIDVTKAVIESRGGVVNDTFYVAKFGGGKLTAAAELEGVKSAMDAILSVAVDSSNTARPAFDWGKSVEKDRLRVFMGKSPLAPCARAL